MRSPKELGWWLKRNARVVRLALARSTDARDRDLARELDRMMTALVGEGWDVR